MIESKYIAGATIPTFDGEVTRLLQEYPQDGGGKIMLVAVENFEGHRYRLITTSGLGAFMHVVQSLEDIGLNDTLAESNSSRNGMDAWFVTTDGMRQPVSEDLPPPPPTDQASDLLSAWTELQALPDTERQSIILSRVGQGVFRAQLIAHWKCCAVTGATCVALLKASHIKPWRTSSNAERLDKFNGLLLSPNLDAAFDSGFITFDPTGKIQLASDIGVGTAYQLHISPKSKINAKLLTEEHQVYLAFHREHVFKG
jgi:hypothetical protein